MSNPKTSNEFVEKRAHPQKRMPSITGKLFIVSGPSGSGKTTLHKELLKSLKLKKRLIKSVSVTTRERRVGERSGRDYFFINKNQFKNDIRLGKFLEWEKVFDNYYGTPKEGVENILLSGKSVLLCIDVRGAESVSRKFPGAIKIFIKVPSIKVLRKRLLERGTESDEALRRRLAAVKVELKKASEYRHVILNDNLEVAFRKLESIVIRELFKSKE